MSFQTYHEMVQLPVGYESHFPDDGEANNPNSVAVLVSKCRGPAGDAATEGRPAEVAEEAGAMPTHEAPAGDPLAVTTATTQKGSENVAAAKEPIFGLDSWQEHADCCCSKIWPASQSVLRSIGKSPRSNQTIASCYHSFCEKGDRTQYNDREIVSSPRDKNHALYAASVLAQGAPKLSQRFEST